MSKRAVRLQAGRRGRGGGRGSKALRKRYKERMNEDYQDRARRARFGPSLRPAAVVIKGVAFEQAPTNFRKQLADLGFDDYAAYIASPHWQAVRRRYRQSGRPLCCFACTSPRYELHHRTYERLGWEALNDLVPLCRGCHEAAHRLEGATVDGRTVTIGDAPEVLKAQRASDVEAA